MLNRREGDLVRPYTGNILLYDFIATQRAPVFLRRNLKLFLYASQQELEANRGYIPATVDPNTPSRATWHFPPEEMVRDYEDQKAFVAVVKALKPLSENGNPNIEPAATKFVPLRIRCQFGLGVWDPDSGVVFCKPSRDAEIVAIRTKDGANVFEVKMREGFREPVARWLTPGKVDAKSKYELQLSLNFLNSEDSFDFLDHVQPRRWNQHGDIPTRFIAKWLDLPRFPDRGRLLQLKCSNNNTVTQIGVEIEMHWTHPRGQTVLAHWNHHYRPSTTQAKSPSRSKAKGPAPATKYQVTYTYNSRQPGLGVSTRHSKVKHIQYDSLICRHCNNAKFSAPLELQAHLSARHSLFNYTFEEELAHGNVVNVRVNCATIRVVYSYPNMPNDLSYDGLHCPHCGDDSFGSVAELRIHLDHSHDKFKYQHQDDGTATNGVQEIRFHGTLNQSYVDRRASDHVPDDHDISMIAPSDPFDQDFYPDSEVDDWIRRARLEKPRPRPQTKATVVSDTVTRTAVKRKLPDEVAPRPEPAKKKFRVPKTPAGITLFRTSTKRALEPGEYVSESDDELDMMWFNLKKAAHTMSGEAGIPAEARPFVKYWDEAIMEEHLTNELYVGDAVIRFAQKASSDGMLHSPGFLPAFRKKVKELWEDKIISDEVHTRLLEVLDQSSTNGAQEPPRKRVRFDRESNRRDHLSHSSRGEARTTTAGQITPQNTDSDGDVEVAVAEAHASLQDLQDQREELPPYNLCICGEDAVSGVYAKRSIWCENPLCVRHCFHVDCIVDQWRPNPVPNPVACNWYCRDCEGERNTQ
jgi:hypothetical protein